MPIKSRNLDELALCQIYLERNREQARQKNLSMSQTQSPKHLVFLIDAGFSGWASFFCFITQALKALETIQVYFTPQAEKQDCFDFVNSFLEQLHLIQPVLTVSRLGLDQVLDSQIPLFLLPEVIVPEAEGLVLTISEEMQTALDQLLERGFLLWEEGMESLLPAYCEMVPQQGINQKRIDALFQQLLKREDLTGANLLLALALLESRELIANLTAAHRANLAKAYHALAQDPNHWQAHLLLLVLGRRSQINESVLVCFPERLQEACRILLQVPYRYLELLAPIQNKTIAIVLPTYNRCHLLVQAIQAIQAQSYRDWVLYLGDDGSADETQNTCRDWAQSDPRIRYFRKNQNSGAEDTLIYLMKQVKEEYLVYCTDDHLMQPEFLSQCMNAYRTYPWIGLAASSLKIQNIETGHVFEHGPYYKETCIVDAKKELQRAGLICPSGPACLYRKSVLAELAPFDIWFDKLEYAGWDYLLNNKLLAYYEVAYVPETLMIMLDQAKTMSKLEDHSAEILYLLSELIQDYNRFFGSGSYPAAIMQKIMNLLYHTIIHAFGEALQKSSNEIQWLAYQERLAASWLAFVKLREALPQITSIEAPALINIDFPYR